MCARSWLADLLLFALVALGVLVPVPAAAAPFERDPPSADEVRAGTWVALGAFTRPVMNAASEAVRRDVGAMATVGIAFDRIAARTSIGGPASGGTMIAAPPEESPDSRALVLPVTRDVARRAVAAAFGAAGLGVDDERIDAIVSRARWSALLPETRLRAMRMLDDRVEDPAASPYYTPYRQNLWLEARLTFRLDRLLYADDEPSLERVRLERIEARARLAARVLEALARWQRAFVDERKEPEGTVESLDAGLRLADAEASLDVLTGGWFGAWRARTQK